MLQVTNYVMRFAPFAVFTAVASAIAEHGPEIIVTFGKFVGSFYLGLAILWAILIGAAFVIVGPRTRHLVRYIRDPVVLAFSTASSEAAYPRTLEALDRFGVPPRIASFVLPLGYSFNLDGSMMYMTFASIFIAQAYGIDLSLGQEITMLLVLMITSKGMAGVPRASLVVIAATMSMFNIPEAGLLLILAVDHFLDMGRSATNVVGNAVASAVVARWEGDAHRSSPPDIDPPHAPATHRPARRQALAERLVDRRRRRGEPLRPARGHVEAVLEPDARLARNVDARLVRKAHARRQRRHLAVDEVDRLMAFHADAVAGAVRGAGQLVARAIAPAFVGAANGIVDAAGGRADLGGGHGDLLPAPHLVPDLALVGARIGAEDEGARDVRLVAVDVATAVEQDVRALADVHSACGCHVDKRCLRRPAPARLRRSRRARVASPMMASISFGDMPSRTRGQV